MAIYARQINPAFQESPLAFFEYPDDLCIFGNRDYTEHFPGVSGSVWNTLCNGDLLEAWEDLTAGGIGRYDSWAAALADLLPPEGRSGYTRNERKKIPKLLERFADRYEEKDAFCEILEIVTGKRWGWRTIRGCSQSEWNEVIFPVDSWSSEALNQFEAEYFNTGSEWIIHDGDMEPETPEDINGFCCYCYGWNADQIRDEIRDISGASEDDEIVLYQFDGVSSVAKYSVA